MHIILYVLDALRADHLGCYGYERNASPHIDSLADNGVVFENCFTSTTWTRPVAASILTGTYPELHQTRTRYDMFATNLTRLPETLQQAGFKTAAFSTMGNIASEIGFKRGFDQYFDLFRDPDILAKRGHLDAAREGLIHTSEEEVALPQAEDINPFLFDWLNNHQEENTFSFIWSIETHEPYRPPESFRQFATTPLKPGEGESSDIRSADANDCERLHDRYDDGIYYNDHCLGEIFSYLKHNNLYDDTLLIIIGDHGEAFFEHGFYTHGHAPYDELIHVPLILKLPQNHFAGLRVSGLAELVDLYPTITAVANIEVASENTQFWQGHNLYPLISGEKQEVRNYTFSDTQSLAIHNRYLSLRDHKWKYIQIQRPKRDRNTILKTVRYIIERKLLIDILLRPRHFWRTYRQGNRNIYLFNLEIDPAEKHNLASEQPNLVQKLDSVLRTWQFENSILARQIDRNNQLVYKESTYLRSHLEKLGYME